MPIIADRVIVELEAKLDKYNANLKRAEQAFQQSTGAQQRQIRALESQISRSTGAIGKNFRALAGSFAAAFSARQVQQLADGYTRFTNQLKVAGLAGTNLTSVQDNLFASAQRYGVELESLGTLYGRGAQVSKELGASQADLLKFTNGVAAALKIQGSSSTEAQGALLQLAQALGSGTVRAEEFNSVNEGALPILKAVAANMDAAGGSVAKLKTLVNDGKVSSAEFFRAFLAGSADLEAQAAKATLTIGNSFTVLNNALGKYIGETDQALSATERTSQAIITLSENLDVVVPALAALTALLAVRFVAAATAGSFALRAISAYAVIATTSLAGTALAAQSAGAAIVRAFGGPVGLAIAALGVAIYAIVDDFNEANGALGRFESSAKAAADEADRMEQKLRDAGVAVADAGSRAADSARGMNVFAQEMGRARQEALRLAQALKVAEFARIAKRRGELQRQQKINSRPSYDVDPYGNVYSMPAANTGAEGRALTDAINAELDALNRQEKALIAGLNAGVDLSKTNAGPTVPGVGGGTPARGRKSAGRGGGGSSDAAARAQRGLEMQARFENEIAQLGVDRLRSIADLSQSADDRAVAEYAALDADRAAFARELKLDSDLDAAQRVRLVAARDAADAERQRAIATRHLEQLAAEKLARESAGNQNEQDVVRAEGDVGDRTARQRLKTERRLIELQFSEEKAQLEGLIASETSTQLEKDIAEAKLARLGELKALALETARLRNLTPFEKYIDEINKTEAEIGEDIERLQVRGLDTLNDGLVDAITGAKSLGEVFHNVANQIIADLLRIAIQQLVIAPLAKALAGGNGGGGGIGGLIGSIGKSIVAAKIGVPGRASGGHVVAGQPYRVTDGEGFVASQSGKIIPLGRMRQAGGRSVTINQTVNVDTRGSVNPDGYAEHIKAAVRKETAAIVDVGMRRVRDAVPARMAQYQRDGR